MLSVPAFPPVDAPEPRLMLPEVPELDVPELNTKIPAAPMSPALPVLMVIAPLVLSTL
jgi:hypothetical protein